MEHITEISHLFKWANLQNQWHTYFFFAWLHIIFDFESVIVKCGNPTKMNWSQIKSQAYKKTVFHSMINTLQIN